MTDLNWKPLFVCVLYRLNFSESPALRSWQKNVQKGWHLSLHIHSSSAEKISLPFNISATYSPENPGLSKAYFAAISLAKTENYSHIIFLDEDTHFPKEFFTELPLAIQDQPQCTAYLPQVITPQKQILSPCLRKGIQGSNLTQPMASGVYGFEGLGYINSGACFKVKDLFQLWNPWKNSLDKLPFLDGLDHWTAYLAAKNRRSFYHYSTTLLQDFNNEKASKESQLKRYRIFLSDYRKLGLLIHRQYSAKSYAFLRALKLSWRYKTLAFIQQFFRSTHS